LIEDIVNADITVSLIILILQNCPIRMLYLLVMTF